MDAEPSSRNWPVVSPFRIRPSMTPRRISKQCREAMDFVEDHQTFLTRKVGTGIGEPREIRGIFEIEVHTGSLSGIRRLGDGPSQGRLPDLAGADEHHGRKRVEVFAYARAEMSVDVHDHISL